MLFQRICGRGRRRRLRVFCETSFLPQKMAYFHIEFAELSIGTNAERSRGSLAYSGSSPCCAESKRPWAVITTTFTSRMRRSTGPPSGDAGRAVCVAETWSAEGPRSPPERRGSGRRLCPARSEPHRRTNRATGQFPGIFLQDIADQSEGVLRNCDIRIQLAPTGSAGELIVPTRG